ncbi:MAG: hypothetical protein ACYDB0_05550 [Acidithiobacillus sp.]
MLDFFWFKRTEVTDSTGRRVARMDAVNMGGNIPAHKQIRFHLFIGIAPANDADIKGATR